MENQPDGHNTIEETLRIAGERMRGLRVNKNISQEDAAKKAGVSLRTLSSLEKDGRSTLETFIRILRALGEPEPLNALVAEPQVSPMALLHSSSSAPKRARKKTVQP